ncbi:MAG: hypothetical protein ABEJ08_01790 [Halobacteriaceae archaeon]
MSEGRGQANLLAVTVAVLLVVLAVAGAVTAGAGALAGATGSPLDRRAAATLAERLVSDALLAVRSNVLTARRLAALDAERLRDAFPAYRDRAVRVRVDDRTLVSTGSVRDGAAVRRLVLVATRRRVRRRPSVKGGETVVDLPAGTIAAAVRVDAATGNGSVVRIDAAGRTRYLNRSGLGGTHRVRFEPTEPTRLAVVATEGVAADAVRVVATVERRQPRTLVVAVDA